MFRYAGSDEWTAYQPGREKDREEVAAVTWAHMWCIDGHFYMARTIEEAHAIFREIAAADPDEYKIVWVHNLKYDFAAALLNIFDDLDVFARTRRDVMIARSDEYKIEFRCSYKLLNTSLRNAAETLGTPTQKGELDYTALRGTTTKLTDQEVEYCRGDVVALYEIMKVYKDQYKRVERIPHTSTGIIRRDVGKKCSYDLYKRTAASQPKTVGSFLLQTCAFFGGYVHANAAHVGDYIEHVAQIDLASAYPAAMMFCEYPSGEMWDVSPEAWAHQKNDSSYLWIARIVFTGVEARGFNSFLSASRMWNSGVSAAVDNGRIRSANIIDTFFTSVDYQIFCENYTFTSETCIEACFAYHKPLDNSFRRYILELYRTKTMLKPSKKTGKGGGDEYRRAKNNINGLFGMAVTNTIRSEVVWDVAEKEWCRNHELTVQEVQDKLDELVRRRKTALPFSTGVFIPAYVRSWLWRLIKIMDYDVIYCDTDSIKFVGEYENLIDDFNAWIMEQHRRVAVELGIDVLDLSPADLDGNRHPLGIFDREKTADVFITLGAKRYAYTAGGETTCTVSGVRKQELGSIYDFYDGRKFDEDQSGKQIAYYIERQNPFTFIDRDGRAERVEQEYAVAIHPTTYELSIHPDFMSYVQTTHLSIFESEEFFDEGEILQSFSD
ncbi:MAG: hypothetical protein J6T77_02680 [Clostridia bacterium]|nr:hypothetical protein [Clostridia bacterium]